MDARPGARGETGRTVDGERAEGGRVLTARRVLRGQNKADLFCGHRRCVGTVGWLALAGKDPTGMFLGDGIFLRERALRRADLVRVSRIALRRPFKVVPASDQDGRAGEPDPVLSLVPEAFPCEVICPRCHRLSVVTEKLVAGTLAGAAGAFEVALRALRAREDLEPTERP